MRVCDSLLDSLLPGGGVPLWKLVAVVDHLLLLLHKETF